MRTLTYILISTWIFAVGCSSKVTTPGTSTTGSKYSEDLSSLRPKIEEVRDTSKTDNTSANAERNPSQYVEPKFAVNDQLDPVLDSIDRINLSRKYIDGYTIQVYSGAKREDALNAKKQISNALPDIQSDVQFVQPNFRVRAGKYFTMLDAQKDYLAVKRYFPNAILIPERIPISN